MEFIKGFTFKLNPSKTQKLGGEETKESLKTLVETSGCETIILAFGALQDTPHSEEIDFAGPHIPTDEELLEVIAYARKLGLKIILKPMLNCRNGVWRAHINFFDLEVPCEPKWSKWFANYEKYILKYAQIAANTKCEMFMVGCELVQTERKEEYWRELVAKVRDIYHGPITYNTDKYQEGEVKWWDCVDVISSSGYYPQTQWEENLDRIEKIVKKYNKPFFFAECGCMCVKGCQEVPNDWSFEGEVDLNIQADYYKTMFETVNERSWVQGYGIWDWCSNYKEDLPEDRGYSVFNKPSAKVIKDFYVTK
ncbi:glycoside hydrolase family 113 [Anaerosporobacter sp.]